MRKLFGIMGILLTLSPSLALAQQACDPDIINALKTQYNLNNDETVNEALYDASCQSSKDSGSGRIAYGDIGVSGGSEDTAQACATHDMNFFNTQSTQLAVSILPPAAIALIPEICSGKILITAKQSAGGDIVVISASFRPNGSVLVAKVTEGLTISPSGALRCASQEISAAMFSDGGELVPAGHSITCIRTTTSDISIHIGTSEGDGQIFLAPQHDIKLVKVNWDHSVDPSHDHDYWCKDVTIPQHPIPIGGYYTCDSFGVCGQNEWQSGECAKLHPDRNCYLSIDGVLSNDSESCS